MTYFGSKLALAVFGSASKTTLQRREDAQKMMRASSFCSSIGYRPATVVLSKAGALDATALSFEQKMERTRTAQMVVAVASDVRCPVCGRNHDLYACKKSVR